MVEEESEFWHRARAARDKLAAQFLYHPDVTLIDIGYAYQQGRRTDQIALRIHVREAWMKAKPEDRIAFPEEVDGIPVSVMRGAYRLDAGEPAEDDG